MPQLPFYIYLNTPAPPIPMATQPLQKSLLPQCFGEPLRHAAVDVSVLFKSLKKTEFRLQLHFLSVSLDRRNYRTVRATVRSSWIHSCCIERRHMLSTRGISSGCCLYPDGSSPFKLTDRIFVPDRHIPPFKAFPECNVRSAQASLFNCSFSISPFFNS